MVMWLSRLEKLCKVHISPLGREALQQAACVLTPEGRFLYRTSNDYKGRHGGRYN